MIYVITNCTKEDYEELSTHLFRRQLELLFTDDGMAYIGVKPDNLFDLSFIATCLKCSLLFKPFGFKFGEHKFHALEIVRK